MLAHNKNIVLNAEAKSSGSDPLEFFKSKKHLLEKTH